MDFATEYRGHREIMMNKTSSFRLCRFFPLLFCVGFFLAAFGCGNTDHRQAKPTALPDDDKVLARVNGSPITQSDLALSIETTLGAQGARMLDDAGRQSMLQSLVAARAISQVQSQNLSAAERSALEKRVAAYREQLLVKMYLAKNPGGEPVTRQMVQQYYDAHPDQFGAGTSVTYETIRTDAPLTEAARDQLLAALSSPAKTADWAAAVERLKQKGFPVTYRKASSDVERLEPQVRDLIGRLKAGRSSEPTFIQGTLYVARLLDERKIAARPLSEVSGDIRKILLPVQLKKAAKQAADQVLKESKVEYMEPGNAQE